MALRKRERELYKANEKSLFERKIRERAEEFADLFSENQLAMNHRWYYVYPGERDAERKERVEALKKAKEQEPDVEDKTIYSDSIMRVYLGDD